MNFAASWIQLKTSERGTTASDRPLGLPAEPPPLEQGEDLDRLAQAHVVGQDAAEAEPLEVVEPAQALALVGPQLAVEARRALERLDPLELVERSARTFSKAASTWISGCAASSASSRPACDALNRRCAVLGGAQVGEHAVLLEPLLGEHAHRAVAQLDHGLAPAGGGEQVGQADALAAEVDAAAELEPVDAGGHAPA